MIRLGDIRKELEKFDYCAIIYNLTTTGCERNKQSYEYIYQLLGLDDDYEIPYNCYEVIYDWDDFGCGDGTDSICFYDDTGFLAQNEKFKNIYGNPE